MNFAKIICRSRSKINLKCLRLGSRDTSSLITTRVSRYFCASQHSHCSSNQSNTIKNKRNSSYFIFFNILFYYFAAILDLYKSSNYYYNMTAKEPPNDLTFRLPKEVKPMHYDVLLHPDLVNGTYTGKVTILLDVREERSYIALHEKDLDIVSTSLRTFDLEENEDVAIKETYSVDKLEVLIVYTHKSIRPGLYNLTISFKGALRPDKIVGFYSSSYRDAHQRTR